MAENKFNSTVAALFTGMDSVVSSKTVVGDAIHIGDTIILPHSASRRNSLDRFFEECYTVFIIHQKGGKHYENF
jgi:hypothetical protein